MAASEELKALLSQIPDHAKNNTYVHFTPEQADQLHKLGPELLKGGRDTVLALIDLLVEPGKGDDTKPHYALHILAVHASGIEDDKARAGIALAMASQLGGDRPKAVQEYLIQELQVVGGKEAVETLGKLLLNPDLCDDAARALAAIGGEAASQQVLAALPKAKDRGRLSVLKKLAILREPRAADAFKSSLADQDPDIRIAATWGLARLADPAVVAPLLKAVEGKHGWVRLNQVDACLAMAEALATAGKKADAAKVYAHVQRTCTDPSESHFRDAAAKGLAAAT